LFRLSLEHAGNATRRVRDGVLEAVLETNGELELARAWQTPDGTVMLQASSAEGLDLLRFVLALDDDHSEFLARFRADPLIGETTKRLRGLRPIRMTTVTHALLCALAGQLIQSSRARAIERSVIRAVSPSLGGLHAPPTPALLGALAPAELRRLGLGARRAGALVRICRSLDLERLRAVPAEAAAARLAREPGLGPWSVGVVALRGLGSYRIGLARDLGLVKLCAALWGRHVEPEETDVLLEPYEEWAGLASVYLLQGFASGMVPHERAA